ncbi:hypothetical protein [Kitasatospora sp. NPDC057223]|uniref:hypothetical protein n=1 Tax=Kitasatospora sp. NPDC057223 TaxID=3346055 RepID=UPI00363BF4A5
MVDGEWWRVNAPRRAGEDGAGAGVPDGPGESIYLPPPVPEQAPPVPPAPPVRPPSVPKQAPPESSSRPDWDRVHIDMSVLDEPAEEAVPEAAPEAEAVPGEAAPGPEAVPAKRPGRRRRAAGAVADAPARRGVLAGRRPSPLLLLASVVLVGGALTGMVLVMLVGWALAYLSRRLGDRTKKFAVLGIPLVAMTGVTLWFWGRSQGRWGVALQPGEQVGQQIWGSAPGVLRLAAALSAAFLLVVTMRRRGE